MNQLEDFVEEQLKAFTENDVFAMNIEFMKLFIGYVIDSAYNEGQIKGRKDAEEFFQEDLIQILNSFKK